MHMLDLHNLSEGASVKAVVVVAEDAHANHAVTKQLSLIYTRFTYRATHIMSGRPVCGKRVYVQRLEVRVA